MNYSSFSGISGFFPKNEVPVAGDKFVEGAIELLSEHLIFVCAFRTQSYKHFYYITEVEISINSVTHTT